VKKRLDFFGKKLTGSLKKEELEKTAGKGKKKKYELFYEGISLGLTMTVPPEIIRKGIFAEKTWKKRHFQKTSGLADPGEKGPGKGAGGEGLPIKKKNPRAWGDLGRGSRGSTGR